MNTRGLQVYKDLVKSKKIKRSIPPRFSFNFHGQPMITFVSGDSDVEALIRLKDKTNDEIVYSVNLKPGTYGMAFREWYTPWLAEAFVNGEKVWEFDFEKEIKGKKFYIDMSNSDPILFTDGVPYYEKFRAKHDLKLTVISPYEPTLDMDPGDVNFIDSVSVYPPEYYLLRISVDPSNKNKNKKSGVTLTELIIDSLGLE